MTSKKIAIPLFALSIVASTMMATTPIFAGEDMATTQKESFFIGWFHKLFNKFKFSLKQENKPTATFGQMSEDLSGTPRAKPSGTPGERQKITDEERLTKLVTAGKITEAQKAAILAELTTLQTTYGDDALKGLTEQERMKKMQEMRAALKAWAEAQGIEVGFVMPELPGNGQGQDKPQGEKQNGERMPRPSGTPKPTPTS